MKKIVVFTTIALLGFSPAYADSEEANAIRDSINQDQRLTQDINWKLAQVEQLIASTPQDSPFYNDYLVSRQNTKNDMAYVVQRIQTNTERLAEQLAKDSAPTPEPTPVAPTQTPELQPTPDITPVEPTPSPTPSPSIYPTISSSPSENPTATAEPSSVSFSQKETATVPTPTQEPNPTESPLPTPESVVVVVEQNNTPAVVDSPISTPSEAKYLVASVSTTIQPLNTTKTKKKVKKKTRAGKQYN